MLVCFQLLSNQLWAQTPYNFITAGAEGKFGPTQAQIDAAYSAGNPLSGKVEVNIRGIQEWIVPVSGTYSLKAAGAKGGGAGGGDGAVLSGEFDFEQGDVIQVLVGQRGTLGIGSTSYNSGGGGGGTFIVNKTKNEILLISGGGGGGNGDYPGDWTTLIGNPANAGINGTSTFKDGGGKNGKGALNLDVNNGQAAHGAGYFTDGENSFDGIAKGGKSFLNGGEGGSSSRFALTNYYGGDGGFGGGAGGWSNILVRGGGGGGYSGGQGGIYNYLPETIYTSSAASQTGYGGGGGSINSGTNKQILPVNASNGYAAITFLKSISLPVNGLTFNGINQYASTPNNSKLEFTTGTVEMWVKPDWAVGTSNDAKPSLISMRSAAGTRYSIHIGKDYKSIGLWNNISPLFIPFNFTKGQWYHIAVVMKASTTDYYIDGNLIGQTTNTLNTSKTGYNLNIGASEIGTAFGTQELFNGSLDEIRVWNTLRTAEEIKNNMRAPVAAASTGLVAYFPIEAGITGAANAVPRLLKDHTANALNGKLYNYYSSNANLSNLTVASGTFSPLFSTANLAYEVKLAQPVTSVAITPTTQDAKATIKINGITVVSGNAIDVPLAIGANTVEVLVTAEDGTTNTYTLTIGEDDKVAPVPSIAVLPVITAECEITVKAPTANDEIDGVILATTNNPIAYTEQGEFTITWTYTDKSGNKATQTQQVIIKDVTAPVLTSVAAITRSNDKDKCGAVVTYTLPAVSDNCMVSFNYFNQAEPNDYGGSEDYIQFLYDGTWNDMPGNFELRYVVEFNTITNENFTNYTKLGDFNGHSYYVSTTEKAWLDAKNAAQVMNGNLVSINSQKENEFLENKVGSVWVGGYHDSQDIRYIEPGNVDQAFGGWKWVDGTSIGTSVTITQTTGLASGALFPIGVTTNTFLARDASGNETTESFTVTIADNQKPTVLVNNFTIQLDAEGKAAITPTMINNNSTDNCGIDVNTIAINKSNFDCSNIGENKVILTVSDINGNEATATAIVTIEDNIASVVTAKNLTIELDANGQATITADQLNNGSTDACGIKSVTVSKTAFNCTNTGENKVILTVTDNSNNQATATVTVTVLDEIAPTITAPAAVVVNVDAGKNTASDVALGTPVTTDNCSVAKVENDAPTAFPTGTTTVTWTVTDASGNTATATQLVTVRANIVSVADLMMIKVPIRTPYTSVPLPAAVEVTYASNEKQLININWSQGNYNGMVAGPYTLTGELILADGTTNLDNKVATVVIEVQPNKVPTALAFSATTFKPEAKADEVIGTLTTTDPDDTEFVYTFVNGDADNSLFEIIGSEVYLKSNNGLSGKVQFSIRVRSTDPYFNTIEKTFTLTKGKYGKTEDQLKIVNAFSPNGDGINDNWTIPELRFYNNVYIQIFDRSGVRVFETTDPETGWNGRSSNGQLLKGPFLYTVEVKDINWAKRGVVTILSK